MTTQAITALKELVGRMTPGPKSERRVAEVLRAGVEHTSPRPYQPVDFDADAHGIVSADRVLRFITDDGCDEALRELMRHVERSDDNKVVAHAIRARLCEIALGTEED